MSYAQQVFDILPLRNIVFSYLKKDNVIYAPDEITIPIEYKNYFYKQRKIIENHTINFKFLNTVFYIINNCFDKQKKKSLEIILKAFNSFKPGGILNKYQRYFIKQISRYNFIIYASIITKYNNKYLKIYYVTQYNFTLSVESFTTKIKL